MTCASLIDLSEIKPNWLEKNIFSTKLTTLSLKHFFNILESERSKEIGRLLLQLVLFPFLRSGITTEVLKNSEYTPDDKDKLKISFNGKKIVNEIFFEESNLIYF